MSLLLEKVKPLNGYSKILHLLLNFLFPLMLVLLVRLNFYQLAFSLVVISKWRMIAIKPRFWLANIRANSVDLIFGLSIVIFMAQSSNIYYQLGWVLIYISWLIFIKPSFDLLIVSLQAFIAQLVGLSAVYLIGINEPLYILVFATGVVCYLVSHHFFDNYDETYSKLLSYSWAYFGASLAWLLGHWLIYYKVLSQPALILSILGYGLSMIYYLDHKNKLKNIYKKEIIFTLIVIVGIIILFSNWGNKVI